MSGLTEDDRVVLAREVTSLAEAISAFRPATDEEQLELQHLGQRFEALVTLLQWANVLGPEHLRFMQQLRPAVANRRVRLKVLADKHPVESPADLDCLALAPICKMRCCRQLDIELSEQDLADGLRWQLEAPYLLARDDKGCVYLGAAGCGCYERRPGTCRSYDCREDSRIWLDFENKIPAP